MYGIPSDFGSAARGYQGQSQSNLGGMAGATGAMSGVGGTLQGYGVNAMQNWGDRGDSAYNLASGIAAREPSWYSDRAAVTSNQAFDESKGVQERALSRMGINPNSGRFVGMQTQWGLARAAAEAGAKTKAQQDAEATTFERNKALLGMAQQGQSQGAGMLNSAGGMYDRAAGNYGELAGTYDRLAGEAAENETVRGGPQTKGYERGGGVQSEIDEMLSAYNPSAWSPREGFKGVVGPWGFH